MLIDFLMTVKFNLFVQSMDGLWILFSILDSLSLAVSYKKHAAIQLNITS